MRTSCELPWPMMSCGRKGRVRPAPQWTQRPNMQVDPRRASVQKRRPSRTEEHGARRARALRPRRVCSLPSAVSSPSADDYEGFELIARRMWVVLPSSWFRATWDWVLIAFVLYNIVTIPLDMCVAACASSRLGKEDRSTSLCGCALCVVCAQLLPGRRSYSRLGARDQHHGRHLLYLRRRPQLPHGLLSRRRSQSSH